MATIINSVKKKPGDIIVFSDVCSAYDADGDCYTVEPGDVGLVVAISPRSTSVVPTEYTVLLGNIILYYLEDRSYHD